MPRPAQITLRIALAAIAAVALSWSASVLLEELQAAPLRRLADRIMSAESFDLLTLQPALSYLDRADGQWACHNPALGYSGVIRQYASAVARRTSPQDAPALLEKAERDLRHFVACSPHQAFYWYELFGVKKELGAPVPELLALLDMSYRLAPAEGWISAFRNEDVLPYFDQMRPELQDRARAEYLHLVRDNLAVAAAIFSVSDEAVRSRLLTFLADTPLKKRKELAATLDYWYDLAPDIPGVRFSDEKPWERNRN